jgi:hypothetical protein
MVTSIAFGTTMGMYSYSHRGSGGIAIFTALCLGLAAYVFISWWRRLAKLKTPMENPDEFIRKTNPLHYPPDQL